VSQAIENRTEVHTNIAPLLPLYLVVLIGFIGYSMMITLFVPMLMDHEGGLLPAEATTSHRTTVLGVLLALYPLGQFFGSPVLGALSDRFGRKPVLIASLGAASVCYVFICLALQTHSLILLCIGCLVCGLAESNVMLTQSAVADSTAPADRGRLFAYIYTTCSISYIIGPISGGLLSVRFGYAAPFWIVLGLLVMTLVWTWGNFKETHSPTPGQRVDYFGAFTNLLGVFTDHSIRRLYLVNFLFYLASFGFFRVILMYMVDEWHMGVGRTTDYYAYLAFVSIIASFGLMPVLSRRLSMKSLAVGGALTGGLAVIAIVIPRAENSLLFTAGPATIFLTLALSACVAMLSSSVSDDRQGSVLGNNQALQVGAEALGSVMGGLMAAWMIKMPLPIFGCVLILGALLLTTFRGSQPVEKRVAVSS
jgi:predicted MFS family arabinose efflux permease